MQTKTAPSTRFLAIENPIEGVKNIKCLKDITRELREELDKQQNLDAQVYLFFAVVIQEKEFVKKTLGCRKTLAELSMDELYTLAKEFKQTIGLQQSKEQYPISSYGINLYKQRYIKRNGSMQGQKRIQAHQSLDNKIPLTNTLFHNFDISQSINGVLLMDVLENFYGSVSDIVVVLNSFGSKEELEKNIIKNHNLKHFIEAKCHCNLGLEVYQKPLLSIFGNIYNLYRSLESMHSIATRKEYNHIKKTLVSSFQQNKLKANFLDAEIKSPERSFTKLLKKYKGEAFKLKDIVRCSFAFRDLNTMVQGINLLLQTLHQDPIYPIIKRDSDQKPFVELEDKIGLLLAPSQKGSGYRDITLIIHFRGQTGLVPMEIQFHLEDTLKAKQDGTTGVYSLVKKYFTDKQINNINQILQEKGSKSYLPLSDNDRVSGDNLYHARRYFVEDSKPSDFTGQKIFKAVMSPIIPIKNLLTSSLTNETIAGNIASLEKNLNDTARKQVLLELHIFDTLGKRHPLKKYLNTIHKE